MTPFPPVEELIAHREAMLLIDRVQSSAPGQIQVTARVDPGAWYADAQGAMPAWVGIELMAQAVAAWAGLQAWQQKQPPKRGFLLGTRAYDCGLQAFPAHSELVVTATELFRESNGLAAFECSIALAGDKVAEATLKVFEPTDFEAFMAQEG